MILLYVTFKYLSIGILKTRSRNKDILSEVCVFGCIGHYIIYICWGNNTMRNKGEG